MDSEKQSKGFGGGLRKGQLGGGYGEVGRWLS